MVWYGFERADIPISANELSKELTRSEEGIIIVAANNTRLPNAREKLTGNLQGILDQRPHKNMGRDQNTSRYKGSEKSNISHERTIKRISIGHVFGIKKPRGLNEKANNNFEISIRLALPFTHKYLYP